jgi:squalene-hopene/tetraprenyl-beta-curcumene cyclase
MLTRTAVVLAFTLLPAWCGDWNPKLAEQYMDSRQQAWVAWPSAMASGVACVSCHTGLPYLLARPALRHTLGETGGPTLYEGVLVASMRATVIRSDAKDLFHGLKGPIVDQVYGAQVVLSALVLAMDDAQRGRMSPEAEASFKRMWSLQVHDGDDKGAWHWSDFDLDPWETKDAAYYGAALGALATGIAPEGYQARPEIRENIAAMKAYLHDGLKTQPLHNRLFLLMASAKLRDLLPDADRQAILDDVWKKQQPDGGWTLESLGQWKKRENAPPNNGSNAYATAVVAYAVVQVGAGHSDAAHSDANLARGLAWLRTHQDQESGKWSADSMNHPHDAGTMPALFMSDAATGYATAALLAAEHSAPHQHGRPTAKVSAGRAVQNP